MAVKLAKHLIQRGQDMDLANANAFEADVFGVAFGTEDRLEGMGAFLEKRARSSTGASDVAAPHPNPLLQSAPSLACDGRSSGS